jgi:hypothetical protein
MRNRIAVFAAITTLTAAMSAASGVAGRWTLTFQSPHGEMALNLTLKEDRTKVTGSLGNPHGGADILVEGEFVDGTLTFTSEAGRGVDVPEMEFKGSLTDADTLTGYLSTPVGDLKCSGKRVKE